MYTDSDQRSRSSQDTPVSAIAVFQPRPATINSDQSAIAILTIYQQRSAVQTHLGHSHASDGCISTVTSDAVATMTQRCQHWLYINSDQQGMTQPCSTTVAVYQQRSAKHDTAASATVAVYQKRLANINGNQQGNDNHDTAVSIIIAVYQQRSAKQLHLPHSRTGGGCIPTVTSEAAAAVTQPCRQ